MRFVSTVLTVCLVVGLADSWLWTAGAKLAQENKNRCFWNLDAITVRKSPVNDEPKTRKSGLSIFRQNRMKRIFEPMCGIIDYRKRQAEPCSYQQLPPPPSPPPSPPQPPSSAPVPYLQYEEPPYETPLCAMEQTAGDIIPCTQDPDDENCVEFEKYHKNVRIFY